MLLKNNSRTVAWYEHGPELTEALVTYIDWMGLLSHTQLYSLKCAVWGVFWECRYWSLCSVSVTYFLGKPPSLSRSLSLSLSLSLLMWLSLSVCVSVSLSLSLWNKHTHTKKHTITWHRYTNRTTPRLMHTESLRTQGIHYLSHSVETWT